MNVGQAIVTALETIGQFLVVEAEQVQDGRLVVVNMHRPIGDAKTQVVGRPVGDARLDAAASHEDGVAVRMMIAAEVLAAGRATLAERGSAKLAAPQNQ